MKVIVIDIDDHDRVKLSRDEHWKSSALKTSWQRAHKKTKMICQKMTSVTKISAMTSALVMPQSEQPNELLSEVVVAAVVDEAEIAVVTEAAIVEVADAAAGNGGGGSGGNGGGGGGGFRRGGGRR